MCFFKYTIEVCYHSREAEKVGENNRSLCAWRSSSLFWVLSGSEGVSFLEQLLLPLSSGQTISVQLERLIPELHSMRMLQGYLFKHCVCVCVFEKTGVSVGNTLALGHHCLTSFRWSVLGVRLLCVSALCRHIGVRWPLSTERQHIHRAIHAELGEKALGRSRSGSTGGGGRAWTSAESGWVESWKPWKSLHYHHHYCYSPFQAAGTVLVRNKYAEMILKEPDSEILITAWKRFLDTSTISPSPLAPT